MQVKRSNSFLGSWTIGDKNRIRAFTHGTCVWNVFKMNFATEVSAKQSSKSRESLRKMRTKSSRWFCMQWTCFHAMSSISTDWDWSQRESHILFRQGISSKSRTETKVRAITLLANRERCQNNWKISTKSKVEGCLFVHNVTRQLTSDASNANELEKHYNG